MALTSENMGGQESGISPEEQGVELEVVEGGAAEALKEAVSRLEDLRSEERTALAALATELEHAEKSVAEYDLKQATIEINRVFRKIGELETKLESEGWTLTKKGLVKLGLEESVKGHKLLVIDKVMGVTGFEEGAKYLATMNTIPSQLRNWVSHNCTWGANGEISEMYSDVPEGDTSTVVTPDSEPEEN